MKDSEKEIIQVSDLTSFFYDRLYSANNKSLCPVPEETIFYSSNVLNKYSLSTEFFDLTSGRVKEKVFGVSFLNASSKSKEEQKKIYKDIADTSLVLTGFFSDSVKRKIIDLNYYIKIGQMAYSKMYSLDETFMDIPHFYKVMATCFENVSTLIQLVHTDNKLNNLNEKEMLISGISPNETKIVS